eukprot:7343018-Pyramimonas_sp.AAC.1
MRTYAATTTSGTPEASPGTAYCPQWKPWLNGNRGGRTEQQKRLDIHTKLSCRCPRDTTSKFQILLQSLAQAEAEVEAEAREAEARGAEAREAQQAAHQVDQEMAQQARQKSLQHRHHLDLLLDSGRRRRQDGRRLCAASPRRGQCLRACFPHVLKCQARAHP